MIKAKAIGFSILLAIFASAQCFETEVLSSVKENTSKSFIKKPSSLDEAHKKCAEHLKTRLGEFLQKVPKQINNDGTEKLGKLVEEKLNKEINLLMGSCDPATLGVAQFYTTKVEPKGNSLNVQQLVIQKIHLKPNLKTEKANITLMSDNELRLTAQLAELTKLREENEALIRSLNSSHFQDVSENNRLKTTLEENIKLNIKYSEEKIKLTRQIENLNSQLNQSNPLKPELEQCKLDKDYLQIHMNNLVRQMEGNCTKMVNDVTEKVKTCESEKKLCEISTSAINQTLARCKDDGAIIATDYSKKTAAIATCEIDKAKSANDLIACLTARNTLAKAIASKIKIQEQHDQINLKNKDTDLSLLTVVSPLSDTSQQSIARLILDEKSALKLKTTCTP